MELLDAFLELLMDGEWRDLTEISDKLGISGVKLGIIAGFFKHYGFIELIGFNAKLNGKVRDFWNRIKWVERAECRKSNK